MELDFGPNGHLVDIQWNTLDTFVKSACHIWLFPYIIRSSSEIEIPVTETARSM